MPKADIFKMNQTGQFFRNTSDKTQNRSFLSSLERRFGNSLLFPKGNNYGEKEKKNEAVFVFFMSLHFNEFSACFI